jgi:opacity protein-like surface antigen
MKMKRTLSLLSAMMIAGTISYAGGDIVGEYLPLEKHDSGFYAGGAVSIQRTYSDDSDWFDDNVKGQDKTVPLTAIAGYQFNEYFAIEGRISKSVYEEDYADVLTYSVFLKPQYPINDDWKVYALIGYGVVDVEGTDGDTPAANVGATIVDSGSFQWGIGTSFRFFDNWSIFVDYTSLMMDKSIPSQPLYHYDIADGRTWDEISDDSINVGVTYLFD